jgi:hypothetical protein
LAPLASHTHSCTRVSDFSSTIRRASKQKEFEASKEDLKSLQETPLQRFQRLQSEIRELSEELSAAAEVRSPSPSVHSLQVY